MKQRFTKLMAALALLAFLALPMGMRGQTTTLVSGSGTSGYTVPEGWTSSGTVEGGQYLKFDDGTITSPEFAPHNGLSFTYSVATFGSGTNHPLTIRILNASTNAVISEMTTATPTSSNYINTDSPLSIGDVAVAFKIQMYAPTGKGVRLRNYSVTGTPASSGPTYTITPQSNNPNYGTVSLSGTTITATPANGYRVSTTTPYTVSPEGSATVAQNGNQFTVTPSANTTVTINFEPIPTHTASFSVNGNTTTQSFAEGAAIIFPSDPDDINDMTFVGWVTEAIDGITNTAPSFVNTATATMGNSDITYYAVFAGGSGTYEETLTISNQDFTQVLTGSYASASITKTVGVTDYIINLFACKQNSMCQLRASDSYIQIPTLPGKITNISTTACNNAGNESYTGTIRLKSAFASGNTTTNDIFSKELSSVNSFSIDLTGDIRSFYFVTSAGLRVNDLTVTYNATSYSEYCTTVPEVAVAKPVITVAENPFLFSTTVTITCATEGATIKYSYDGETWNDYSTTLTINETKTIYAKGVNGIDESSIASVTATKNLATPTVTIDASGITNTDFYLGTDAGVLSASVTYNDAPVQGATVTWSGNNNAVATIDANSGAVTLSGKGNVIFTATFAGDDNYASATAIYQLTVTSSAPSVDYAVLPFVWQGGSKSTFLALNGVTAKGLGSDYAAGNAPYLIKLDDTGDYIQVKTDSQPNVVTIGVKMLGGANTSTITIQGSADGETFTNVEELTISGAQNDELTLETTSAFTDNVRYVRMLFTKGSNVGVGLIAICKSSLDINGHGGNAGNWYLIASPLTQNTAPTAINGLVAADEHYDLYRFNQNPTVTNENDYLEWENYKIHTNGFVLENGKGYLYASQTSTTLYFNGECNTGATKMVNLDYSETNPDVNMRGWNLVGNPFTTVAYADHSYFVMDGNGTSIVAEPVSSSTAINPFTGVFVQATATNQSVTFSKTAPRTTNNKGVINLALSQQVNRGSAMVDKAVVSFNEGDQLGKFVFMESNAKLYIPKNGKDYAIAVAEGKGEMPINFKAEENGTYTLSIDTENVEMNYLHLIDNMTGMDVDLLQTPSYTFDATTNDYTSRFRLVFAAGASTGSETSEDFAFFSNGSWVVNNEGEATLQVVDVNGRIVSNEAINGSVNKTITATPGIYMLRLVNGNEVKTQKIVVK